MNFLQAISGTKYETQSSAALCYLLVNSSVFRKHFVGMIAGRFSRTDVPTFSRGIQCYREHGNQDVGRIDLVVQADNMVLGIENKLWAGFQCDQPAKYATLLQEIALQKFDDKARYRILTLAPVQRQKEIETHVSSQEFESEHILIFWQSIKTEVLECVQRQDSRTNAVIAELLAEFLELEIGNYADMDFRKHQLIGSDVKITNQYHKEFLERVKSCFSECDPSRMGYGNGTYAGFYFSLAGALQRNWFGFHSPTNNGLGAALSFDTQLSMEPLGVVPESWKCGTGPSERPHRFTFASHSVWPSKRVEWLHQVDSMLEYLRQHTDCEQQNDEINTTKDAN